MKKNILVTGGAGFIGSHLCEGLLKQGHSVTCMDDLSTGSKDNLSHLKENFQFVKGDANSLEDLKRVFLQNSFDTVFHYAAVIGVKRTLEHPLAVLNDVNGFQHLMALSRKHNVKQVIFSSSSEVYGEALQLPSKEEGQVNAQFPYAVTKMMGEKSLRAYYEEFGMNTTSLRFFNVFGPRQDSSPYGFVVGIFIKQILEGKSPTIFGDGMQTRDFVFINDNINATLKVLDNKKCAGEVMNIGCGKPITVLKLAEVLIKMMGSNVRPVFKDARCDIRHRAPDISKMKALTGYSPDYSLEQGLQKTIDYYKEKSN